MMIKPWPKALFFTLLPLSAAGLAQPVPLPTGQMITPMAAPSAKFVPLAAEIGPFPDYQTDGAAAIAVSPDGRQMLILTSGFNRVNGKDGKLEPAQSGQYVFVYTISAKGAQRRQSITLPNSYSGIAWHPDGSGFAVSGGVDDNVRFFARRGEAFVADGDPVKLGHGAGVGIAVQPQAAGVAISPDGKAMLVANYYNDSVSLIDVASRKVVSELDLRPGKIDPAKRGVAGGEFPLFVTWRDNGHAWVSSTRDRQIVALTIAGARISVAARVATIGQPTALYHDPVAARLYAVEDNADRLAIINARTDTLIAEPRLGLPAALAAGDIGKGINPNSIAMTPDRRLLITYGGINALAIVQPRDAATSVAGLVPTGWYPTAAASSRDGRRLFVINRKSPGGPNPLGCAPKLAITKAQPDACGAANQYIYQLQKAGLLHFPTPAARALAATTQQVAANIGLSKTSERAAADAVIAKLRERIKHVIFIVKENRTYDQVLGDLEIGNGDPALAILGEALSPVHHDLARQFVTLDNFYDSGEQSSTGWTWTTAGRVTDLLEKTAPVNYAQRGLSYEAEQSDRNIATNLTLPERRKVDPRMPDDPDLMPGRALNTAPDGDADDLPGQGFIWNAAIRAGLSVRNYGFADASVYDVDLPGTVPLIREPSKEKRVIWTPTDRDLASRSNVYFRGYDQKMPDYWRVLEWQREYDQQAASGTLPALTLLRLSHDHFGEFANAIDGVNTVETQMADNDYALGLVVERVAKGPAKGNTLIFVIEDDAQNGTDHVDARRSLAFVVGPYVKQKALVSTRYNSVDMLRTIGSVLGLKPLGLNDALAMPMADVFDLDQVDWTFTARAADVLKTTALPIPLGAYRNVTASANCPQRSAAYWSAAMAGQNFASEDQLDADAFNAALWAGLGAGPAPVARSGLDLRANRNALLAQPKPCNAR